jgi:hypothetical protein
MEQGKLGFCKGCYVPMATQAVANTVKPHATNLHLQQ